MRICEVYVGGVFAGTIEECDGGGYVFLYDDLYRSLSGARPVCLAMPLSQKEYTSESLFPYFANLVSEGANRRQQSQLLGIDKKDDFGILMATAQYDAPGIVTVKPIIS